MNCLRWIVVGLVMVVCAGCDSGTASSSPQTTPKPVNTYATGGSMTLGGTVDAFVVKWGKPGIDDGVGTNYQQHCGQDGKTWCLVINTLPGADGKRYVADITVQGIDNGSEWDLNAAKANCERYAPQDARLLQETPATFSDNVAGLERIFAANSLAQTFAPDLFNDIQGQDVQPGTFNIQYISGASLDSGHVSACRISLGTAI